MTQSLDAPESTARESSTGAGSLTRLIAGLVHDLRDVLSPGDLAELRRMRPGGAGCAAYWKLVAGRLDPENALPESTQARDALERKWTVVLASLARLAPLHRSGARLGRALADADVSEARLLRLLRARSEALEDAIRVLTHQLASSGTPVDCTDLAWLVLSEGRSDEMRARRRVARDYYSSAPRA